MDTKLHEIVAVVNGAKKRNQQAVTEIYQRLQKFPRFMGIAREYRPLDEGGETLPAESKGVQQTVASAITAVKKNWGSTFDTVATQDAANCRAKADVKIQGVVILANVPVTHLLYLEKRAEDLVALVEKLPVLPLEKNWTWDVKRDCFVSAEEITRTTKKIPQAHVLYDATEQHPAQVNEFHVDECVGHWHTTHLCGAIEAQKQAEMLERAIAWLNAVKTARTRANGIEVSSYKTAGPIFEYVFEGAMPAQAEQTPAQSEQTPATVGF